MARGYDSSRFGGCQPANFFASFTRAEPTRSGPPRWSACPDEVLWLRRTALEGDRSVVRRGPSRFREGPPTWSRPVSRILSPAPSRRAATGGGHPSGTNVAVRLMRPTRRLLLRAGGPPNLLLGLAPDGVYLAAPVARHAGELLPHRFTLASAPASSGSQAKRLLPDTPIVLPAPVGGLLSVALSTGRPAWDIPQRPALWSPDFPRPRPPDGDRSRGRPACSNYRL